MPNEPDEFEKELRKMIASNNKAVKRARNISYELALDRQLDMLMDILEKYRSMVRKPFLLNECIDCHEKKFATLPICQRCLIKRSKKVRK